MGTLDGTLLATRTDGGVYRWSVTLASYHMGHG